MARNAQPDLSEFQELQPRIGPPSKLGRIRQTLSSEDRVKLDAALADRTISVRAVKSWLAKRGHPISESALANWRRDL